VFSGGLTPSRDAMLRLRCALFPGSHQVIHTPVHELDIPILRTIRCFLLLLTEVIRFACGFKQMGPKAETDF
jgi:hypothetical protein